MPPVLYEDNFIIVINKPAGLVVHPDGRGDFETLSDMILGVYPDLAHVGEPLEISGKKILRPGIVHRIDKETSGCLIIAKTQESFLFMKDQFQNHTIQKMYHACLFGVPKERSGRITEGIGRSRGDIRKWTTSRGARGEMREAITEYSVLATIGGHEGKGSTDEGTYTYVEAKPETGRTHQLRVHFKHINHPIVGDSLYGGGRGFALGFERLALHARAISFVLPDGIHKDIEAPFPADFENARIAFGL